MARLIQTIDSLPVRDATEPLWLEVLPADIDKHAQKDPENCAVAQACKRGLHAVEARAYRTRLYIRYPDQGHWLRYILPDTVRSEVAAFDRGGGFTEGTYYIPRLPLIRHSGHPGQGGKKGTGRGKTVGHTRPTHRIVASLRPFSPLSGGAIEPPPKKHQEVKGG